ncbi:unnamed protein product [Meloidogyne enterolobii]|uniref:Uncharacterized protein n=2 Tax=Meloidogyne enterolobii TaxID=390850 RepID=A0ACB0ZBA2_MELEN
MKKLFIFCFLFLIIGQLINVINTCLCNTLMTQEDKYCHAHWVAHLLILGSKTIDKQQQYNVKYLKVYRDTKGILNGTNLVYFYAQFPGCGIYLKEGTEYLIFGSYTNGKFPINLNKCLTNLEWNNVNGAFRESLNNGYFDKICEASEQNNDD